MPPVISLVGVGRVFDGVQPVNALRDVNLHVHHGEYVAIVGPSGSGKSTLLNILGLLDRSTSGRYELDGIRTEALSDRQRSALRAQRVGFVFQAFHLLSRRTVFENVLLGFNYRRLPSNECRQRALRAIREVGLEQRCHATPNVLSGGERQRVAIARALAIEPALLLCDEPTGNLDSSTSESILDLFDHCHRQGVTVLAVTHDDLVSARAQRVVRINDGTVDGG